MKTLSILLLESDPGGLGDYEFVGAFFSDFELVRWLWTELKQRPGFTAWPVGGDRDNAEDVAFQENVAQIQLRPFHPPKSVAGLGPLHMRRVWVKQHEMQGDFGWVVATFETANVSDEAVIGFSDLRSIMSNGGRIFTHLNSALGQRIEEDHNRQTARGVQDAIRSVRGVVRDGFLTEPSSENELFVCEHCTTAPVVGVVFPIASNEDTSHAYVEQCDDCRKYRSDLDAAAVLGHLFQLPIKQTGDGKPYVDGMTYEEAEAWDKQHRRSVPSS